MVLQEYTIIFHFGVFKAKFFPDCSIMQCEISDKGSYAWKSLLQARYVVESGAGWRVGDGQSVVIRSDKWLPKNPPSLVISPPNSLPVESNVSDLIDQENHIWKLELIQSEFLTHEASLILSIPLSCHPTSDEQVWFLSKDGKFTTRSAYHLTARIERSLSPTCSSPERSHKLWSSIWCSKVPQKVKNMIWRACHNAIPTLYNLWRRKVVNSVQCLRCKEGVEDTIHALWYCPALNPIWYGDEMLTKLHRYKFDKFDDLMGMVFMLKERLDVNLLLVMLWLIWSNRNATRSGSYTVEISNIRTQALSFLQDFLLVQNPLVQPSTTSVRAVRWISPINPHCKVNFDAAVFSSEGTAGLGVIIRDCSGKVLHALAHRIVKPISVAAAEALACRRAMFFAKELGMMDCIFEGDAEVIVRAIRSSNYSHLEYGNVIRDVRFLENYFSFCVFSHVKRQGNLVAHCLARSSKSGRELQVWQSCVLDDIAPIVTHDSL